MSRNRTGKICPTCKKPCYFEEKPTRNNKKGDKRYRYYWYAVHYDSTTGKRTSCCIDKFVSRYNVKSIRLDKNGDYVDIHGKSVTNASKPISDERLKELLDSPYDRIETIAEYALNYEQIKLLANEELKQYIQINREIITEGSRHFDQIINEEIEKMKLRGLDRGGLLSKRRQKKKL